MRDMPGRLRCVYKFRRYRQGTLLQQRWKYVSSERRNREVHDTLSLSEGVIEASPAVYGNSVVVGTRDCKNLVRGAWLRVWTTALRSTNKTTG